MRCTTRARFLLLFLTAGALLVSNGLETAGAAETQSAAGLVGSGSTHGSKSLARTGSSSRGHARTSSRHAIDAGGLSRSRRGLSRVTRSELRARNDRVRFRGRGHRRHTLTYPYRYRSGGATTITLYSVSPRPNYIVTRSPSGPRSPRDGLCQESATRVCITPGADFHSVELLCDTVSHRFATDGLARARRLRCPQGLISSVWIERPGSTTGEGEGMSLQFNPSNCPVPSPCENNRMPPSHTQSK